jgi:hypothetical protein
MATATKKSLTPVNDRITTAFAINETTIDIDFPIDRIEVPEDYFRKPSPNRQRAMIEDFEPRAVGLLEVNYRKGEDRYVLLDGQDRLAAMKTLGYTHCAVRVHQMNAMSELDASISFNSL